MHPPNDPPKLLCEMNGLGRFCAESLLCRLGTLSTCEESPVHEEHKA